MFLKILIVLHFNINKKITGQTSNNRRKDVEIMVLSKGLSNFCKTLEMLLINFQINSLSAWCEKCIIVTRHVL